MTQIEADLAMLEQAGQNDLVEEFHQRFERLGRLETELAELRDQLENE
jgi:Skp family chaperone for outer membrane proteins